MRLQIVLTTFIVQVQPTYFVSNAHFFMVFKYRLSSKIMIGERAGGEGGGEERVVYNVNRG